MKNLGYILLICLFFSCKKEEPISEIPSIEFVEVSPRQIVAFQEKLVFTIAYTDGDGDLGENDSDIKNLFLKDNRNDIVYEYRISQLAPLDTNIFIQGQLNIELEGTRITNNSQEQSATFDIYLQDRSGNQSNTVTSSSIIITSM